MTLKTILIFVGLATVVTAFLQASTPTVSIMQPQGIKFIIPGIVYLRNRFLLIFICCPVHHWLKVSCEVDTSRARSACDIFTDD